MPGTPEEVGDAATRLIDAVQEGEHNALEAVRRFVDTVNGAFPDVGGPEEGPRRQIIDSAFKMVEQLLGVSNRFAEKVVTVTESTLNDLVESGSEEGDTA